MPPGQGRTFLTVQSQSERVTEGTVPSEGPVPQESGFRHSTDYALEELEFTMLQQMTGREFQWDACCNNDGTNSLCGPNFSSPAASFLEKDCSGMHVWINPPFKKLAVMLAHYAECKKLKPESTSACILVPRWRGGSSWRKHLQGMRLLTEYNVDAQVFRGGKLGPFVSLGVPVEVWYDPPAQSDPCKFGTETPAWVQADDAPRRRDRKLKLNAFGHKELTMRFEAKVGGSAAKVHRQWYE